MGVTEVTARRKLKRLMGDGIIRVVATVDPFDVGYETPVIIGLKVHRGQMDAVAERLSLLPQVRYVGASTGRVDLIIEVVTRTNQDLADFLLNELAADRGDHGLRDEPDRPDLQAVLGLGHPRATIPDAKRRRHPASGECLRPSASKRESTEEEPPDHVRCTSSINGAKQALSAVAPLPSRR